MPQNARVLPANLDLSATRKQRLPQRGITPSRLHRDLRSILPSLPPSPLLVPLSLLSLSRIDDPERNWNFRNDLGDGARPLCLSRPSAVFVFREVLSERSRRRGCARARA